MKSAVSFLFEFFLSWIAGSCCSPSVRERMQDKAIEVVGDKRTGLDALGRLLEQELDQIKVGIY